eukprot:9821348-Alexandrium_andersonii.AAC.1
MRSPSLEHLLPVGRRVGLSPLGLGPLRHASGQGRRRASAGWSRRHQCSTRHCVLCRVVAASASAMRCGSI